MEPVRGFEQGTPELVIHSLGRCSLYKSMISNHMIGYDIWYDFPQIYDRYLLVAGSYTNSFCSMLKLTRIFHPALCYLSVIMF